MIKNLPSFLINMSFMFLRKPYLAVDSYWIPMPHNLLEYKDKGYEVIEPMHETCRGFRIIFKKK